MKYSLSLVLLSLSAAFLFQACGTTGSSKAQTSQDSLWNNRIGTYTYGEAVAQYGQPKSRKELSNGLSEVYWEQSDFYDSSKSAPQTMTVDKSGQVKPSTQTGVISFKTVKLTLLFDKEGKLRSWQQK